MNNKNITIIIDGNSVAYRAFYKAPPLSAEGTPTGVIHVFLSVLESLNKKDNIGKILVVFDAKGKNHRHKLLEKYKETRSPMPEDLIVQMDILKDILKKAGYPIYCIEGYEADDVIYTLAQREVEKNIVWLITKDKDLHQMINDKVFIYDYKDSKIINRDSVFEKFGLYPESIQDMLALSGDSSDNIPGVPGIGLKTAVSLLEKYNNLDNIYTHVNEVKGKLKEKLIDNKNSAYLSKELVKLINISDLPNIQGEKDNEAYKNILEKYKLITHLNKLLDSTKNNKLDKDIIEKDTLQNINLRENNDNFTFTESKVKKPDIILYISNTVYIASTIDKNYEEYEDYTIKNSFEYCYDLKSLIKNKILFKNEPFDIMLGSWLVNPDIGGIKFLKNDTVGSFIYKIVDNLNNIKESLKKLSLDNLYYNIELPVTKILAESETTGIKIDSSKIFEINHNLKAEITKILAKVCNDAKAEINLNSPKQLSHYLFDILGLKPIKKNKSGFSTDEESLLELRAVNPDNEEIIDNILKYRELNKIVSTYTINLLNYKDSEGRIHTEFKQTGTATGRLSSVNPNLQNIPTKTEDNKNIRSAFIPEAGYSFVSLDYSQIELRVLAHMSKDKNLSVAFFENEDIHTQTAINIFNLKDPKDVTVTIRKISKAVNFGILYGLSAFGLARDAKVPVSEAKIFIDKYFSLYPKVKEFINDTISITKINGYVGTLLGRKRFIKDINSRNGTIRQRAERIAINAPIQGSASDIIKLAMIECDKFIKKEYKEAKLLLQIHDELLFEVKDQYVVKFKEDIKKIMENVIKLDIPLVVNSKSGKSWGNL